MIGHRRFAGIRNAAQVAILATLLAGCLSDEDADEDAADLEVDNEVSGSVGDGPVVGAAMRIRRNDGVELSAFESDASASYNIAIRTKGKYYPLLVDARNGIDIVTNTAPDFTLLGAVIDPGKKTVANANPFSTFAVELATDLSGGATKTNLSTAQSTVSAELNFGLSSLVASGPMSTRIDGGNIAELVRASEALGESMRRTRDAIRGAGYASSGDITVRALASDLTDSVVDGRGGPRSDARHAAVFIIVAAQVALETMANELHVNGIDGTSAMSSAIDQVLADTAKPTLSELIVTAEMLAQIEVGLAAAFAVTGDEKIRDLLMLVKDVEAGTSSATIRNFILPDDYRSHLNNAVLVIASGSSDIHETVNVVSRTGNTSGGSGNRAPSISGSPAGTVVAGSSYSFSPTASDPEGDDLTFFISGKPAWASFDSATGILSGSPTEAHVGAYQNIVIRVSDGEFSDSLAGFAITVSSTSTNSAPLISGTAPSSVNAGSAYSFTPNSSDPDGDSLSFSASGLPNWASIDNSNGQISGTPQNVDVGTYGGIVISVSDGQASSSLAAFSITVDAISLGSATLNWTPPTQNTDGSTLTDLAGYKIYWGTSPGNYPNSITINNASVSTYVVDNLAPGTYEFVATAFNTEGIESRYSGAATKVVP